MSYIWRPHLSRIVHEQDKDGNPVLAEGNKSGPVPPSIESLFSSSWKSAAWYVQYCQVEVDANRQFSVKTKHQKAAIAHQLAIYIVWMVSRPKNWGRRVHHHSNVFWRVARPLVEELRIYAAAGNGVSAILSTQHGLPGYGEKAWIKLLEKYLGSSRICVEGFPWNVHCDWANYWTHGQNEPFCTMGYGI